MDSDRASGLLFAQQLLKPFDQLNLRCKLLVKAGLHTSGEVLPVPERDPVLVLLHLQAENTLRCQQKGDCFPCVQVMLHLGLLESPALGTDLDGEADKTGRHPRRHNGRTNALLKTRILLLTHGYASSRSVIVEVSLPHDWHSRTRGSLQVDCFPIALEGELHIKAVTSPRYQSMPELNYTHYGPSCSWSEAKDAILLCQVPRLKITKGLEEVVLHVLDVPLGQHLELWLYRNQTRGHKGIMDKSKALIGPENVSIPISNVFPCLCLQVWIKGNDSPRTHLCPFANDTEAWDRAWSRSQLKLTAFNDTSVSCFLNAPCDQPGELVPCWRGELFACYPLPPQLHLAITPHEVQELPGLRPHPNLCVQVRRKGRILVQSCLLEESHQPPGQQLLLWETPGSQGNSSLHALEQGKWVPIAEATSTGIGSLEEALKNDVRSGECMQVWFGEDGEIGTIWACSLEKYHRKHWTLACIVTFLGICSLLLVVLLKKDTLKGWLRKLKEDYSSGGALPRRHILILYSPDHAGFERLVAALASTLTRLQLTVSLELWSHGERGSLGPMQWLHAQRLRVLKEGGAIVLLFSQGAVASCAEWLGWEQKGRLSHVNPDSSFLATLNCILPDFQAGKARDRYLVACFEELLPVDEIPGLFHSVPIYPLPSQVFNFLLALAGPSVGHERRSRLKTHAVWISKSLERAVQECQQKMSPGFQHPLLPPPQPRDARMKEISGPLLIET
ncbi:interleukin-17 receptor C [Tiliqua scincoides]|uniref:interleukin-17 receptor C n=1 Tax=Tiliqua scincoides TaxID=71010 RepID=UPI0034637D47